MFAAARGDLPDRAGFAAGGSVAMYRYDASYALEVYTAHPGRFRPVKPVDPTDSGVADTIADWAATKGTVGIRLCLRDNVSSDPADPGINRVLATAAQHSLSVNLACTGRLDQAAQLASRKSQYATGDRPPRPATTARAATSRGAVRGFAKAAGPGAPRQHRGGACTLSHEPSLTKTPGTLFEGFDTPDLKEAKALLDELGTARS